MITPNWSLTDGLVKDFRSEYASGGAAKWIQKAVPASHKGLLHRKLGVPEGEKIPESKIEAAANSSSPTLRREANFAKNVKGLGKK